MRFNRRMSMNMNANNKLADATIGNVSGSSSVRVGELQNTQRYVYPPQASAQSHNSGVPGIAESVKAASEDHTIMTVLPQYSRSTTSSTVRSTQEYAQEQMVCGALSPLPSNILVGTAATDGIGLSTSLSLLARHLTMRGHHVALVDADLVHGGLDVLLGLESDEGRRLQEVEAPLGHCDGYVLCNELVHWDGVDVLAFAPWQGKRPEPWVVEAAIRALAEACDVVIVDIGAGEVAMQAYKSIPQLANLATLAAVELSVLDLARFRAFFQRFNSVYSDGDGSCNKFGAIGLAPRGLTQKSYVLHIDEAAEYLTIPILGSLSYDARMYASIVGGYGIRGISAPMKATMKQIERWLLGDVIARTKDAVAQYRRVQYRHLQHTGGRYGSE